MKKRMEHLLAGRFHYKVPKLYFSREKVTVSLKAGENVIRLTVNNTEKQFATGTMDAAAPLIDCICVYANAELSMEEFDN